MRPERIPECIEVHTGTQGRGLFMLSDCINGLDALMSEYENGIKLIYMDPPYLSGDKYFMRVRVGAQDWDANRSSLKVLAFDDHRDRASFLEMMRNVLTRCRRLLTDDGMIFVHVDYRLNPHIHLLMDKVFGEENFLNEIIWVYQTGGRSIRHFSRKHDVILFYRKTDRYDFNIDAVKTVPVTPRTNHMRRHVDPDGRVYRSIRTGGKVYTYYDDDPVAPTDVWNDLSHLQQRDPERTGYDTQKPLQLLDRIVRCASRPGEWVLDPFAGSSTTLAAAQRLGRYFIGIDDQPLTLNIARRRLQGGAYEITQRDHVGAVPTLCDVDIRAGVGFYHIVLNAFEIPIDGLSEAQPLDHVDNWSVGYIRNGRYEVMSEFYRRHRMGALSTELKAPVFAGQLAMCVSDVLGNSWYYKLDTDFVP
ncbi:MAG: site-specific DNA-methyltransferase [Clostridia bacterium]|nr:site-specific DNA-methyltransferase [Clostridia bacterium]